MRIGVLMGGVSSEREISLRSGKNVTKGLRSMGYEVLPIDVKNIYTLPEVLKQKRIDLAFIALHGRYGEDGTVQGLLECLNIPYTGSGVLSSALAMHKGAAKKIFLHSKIPTPPFLELNYEKFSQKRGLKDIIEMIEGELGYPVIFKPAQEGSTIGVSIVRRKEQIRRAIKTAFSYDKEIIIEKYISGTEITAAILGNEELKILPLMEIVSKSKSKFYDYNAKYTKGKSLHIIPPRISNKAYKSAEKVALLAHRVLKCAGISRVDMIVDEKGRPYVLEVNTVPGMTEMSLVPEAARAEGIDFPTLLDILIKLALNERKKVGSKNRK